MNDDKQTTITLDYNSNKQLLPWIAIFENNDYFGLQEFQTMITLKGSKNKD